MTVPDASPLAALFLSCASALAGDAGTDGYVSEWLGRLGYRNNAPSRTPHRARILRAAARFTRLVTLEAPDTPGLVAVGAEADPACLGLSGQPVGSVDGCAAAEPAAAAGGRPDAPAGGPS
jgi:hypothetical protein